MPCELRYGALGKAELGFCVFEGVARVGDAGLEVGEDLGGPAWCERLAAVGRGWLEV